MSGPTDASRDEKEAGLTPGTETVGGHTRFHSGELFSERPCPIHGKATELCIDDTDFSRWSPGHQILYNHHDNRIQWYCAACLGFWLENHFLDQSNFSKKYSVQHARLILTCPECKSARISHECEPGCCDTHVCVDCTKRFNASVKTVRRGNSEQLPEPQFRDNFGTSTEKIDGIPFRLTGIRRTYRSCDMGCSGEMKLALVTQPGEGSQVAWLCAVCDRLNYEKGGFRARRHGFEYEVKAQVQCSECFSLSIQSNVGGSGTSEGECRRCGSTVTITLEPLPKQST